MPTVQSAQTTAIRRWHPLALGVPSCVRCQTPRRCLRFTCDGSWGEWACSLSSCAGRESSASPTRKLNKTDYTVLPAIARAAGGAVRVRPTHARTYGVRYCKAVGVRNSNTLARATQQERPIHAMGLGAPPLARASRISVISSQRKSGSSSSSGTGSTRHSARMPVKNSA